MSGIVSGYSKNARVTEEASIDAMKELFAEIQRTGDRSLIRHFREDVDTITECAYKVNSVSLRVAENKRRLLDQERQSAIEAFKSFMRTLGDLRDKQLELAEKEIRIHKMSYESLQLEGKDLEQDDSTLSKQIEILENKKAQLLLEEKSIPKEIAKKKADSEKTVYQYFKKFRPRLPSQQKVESAIAAAKNSILGWKFNTDNQSQHFGPEYRSYY